MKPLWPTYKKNVPWADFDFTIIIICKTLDITNTNIYLLLFLAINYFATKSIYNIYNIKKDCKKKHFLL